METTPRFHLTYVLLALFGVFLVHDLWVVTRKVAEIPYSEFERLLEEGKVAEVVVSQDRIRGELSEPRDGKTSFVTNRVDPELARTLEERGVRFSAEREDRFLPTLLSWVVPVLLFFGLWMFLMRRMAGRDAGGFLAIGRSKAKVYVEADTKVLLDLIAPLVPLDEHQRIIFDLKAGRWLVTSWDGKASVTVPFAVEGPPIRTAVRMDLLSKALRAWPAKTVRIGFGEGQPIALSNGDDWTILVAPVALA